MSNHQFPLHIQRNKLRRNDLQDAGLDIALSEAEEYGQQLKVVRDLLRRCGSYEAAMAEVERWRIRKLREEMRR